MKIANIKKPLVFVALERVCSYIVNEIWQTSLGGDDIVEAEFRLAVNQSKEYEDDIKIPQ